jgi:hypothetical protein
MLEVLVYRYFIVNCAINFEDAEFMTFRMLFELKISTLLAVVI